MKSLEEIIDDFKKQKPELAEEITKLQNGNALLTFACYNNERELIIELLSLRETLKEKPGVLGVTPSASQIGALASHGHLDLLKIYLDAGVDPSSSPTNPLKTAAKNNFPEIVECLLDWNDKKIEKADPNAAFFALCATGLTTRARTIAPQLTTTFHLDNTAQQSAANGQLESLKLLDDLGYDLTAEHILIEAAKNEHATCTHFLLELGNTKEKNPPTYLACLCALGEISTIKTFLEENPLTEITYSALNLATRTGHLEILKILTDRPSNFQIEKNELLNVAVFHNQAQITKYLLEKGATPQKENNQTLRNTTFKKANPTLPLILACYNDQELRKIIQAGPKEPLQKIASQELTKRQNKKIRHAKAAEPELEP